MATFASPWWGLLPVSERELQSMNDQFQYSLQLLQRDQQRVRSTLHSKDPINPLLCRYEAVDARHPLLCSLRLTAWRHWDKLLFLTLLWSLFYYAYTRLQSWRRRARAHRQLAAEVKQRIRERAGEPVIMDHLRDELWSEGEPEVWQRSLDLIDRDTRVEGVKVRVGHVMREAWRWVGEQPAATAPHAIPSSAAASRTAPPSSLTSNQPSVAPASFGTHVSSSAEGGGVASAEPAALSAKQQASTTASSWLSTCRIA